jgi:hypothetical protein
MKFLVTLSCVLFPITVCIAQFTGFVIHKDKYCNSLNNEREKQKNACIKLDNGEAKELILETVVVTDKKLYRVRLSKKEEIITYEFMK